MPEGGVPDEGKPDIIPLKASEASARGAALTGTPAQKRSTREATLALNCMVNGLEFKEENLV